MKTKHQFTLWWENLFSHLLPSFLLAKIILWHFHVFHTERARMDSWNAASHCTDNRVLARSQPQLGSMGGIPFMDSILVPKVSPPANRQTSMQTDKVDREHAQMSIQVMHSGMTAAQRGKGPELTDGLVPVQMDIFPILNMCLGPRRSSREVFNNQHTEHPSLVRGTHKCALHWMSSPGL